MYLILIWVEPAHVLAIQHYPMIPKRLMMAESNLIQHFVVLSSFVREQFVLVEERPIPNNLPPVAKRMTAVETSGLLVIEATPNPISGNRPFSSLAQPEPPPHGSAILFPMTPFPKRRGISKCKCPNQNQPARCRKHVCEKRGRVFVRN
jgi:hypothetical protein